MRRIPRAGLAGVAAVLAVVGLAGCRTSPTVAAYVGDRQITVSELDAAVDQRLSDPAVAKFAAGREDTFTRQVLSLLVGERVYAAAAERFGVSVSDDEVRARITQLLGGNDPDTVYAQLAAQGIGRGDIFENVRQQLLRQKIAAAQGLAGGLSEAALQQRYDQTRDQRRQVQLGYITVPDQATADAVLAQLTANPASYPQVAAAHPGQATLPAVQAVTPDRVPAPLADQVAAARPGTGFTVPVPGLGVVVGFVAGVSEPTFAKAHADLEQAAAADVDQAAQK